MLANQHEKFVIKFQSVISIQKQSFIQIAKLQEEKEKRKEEKKRAEVEIQTLFKPVITQQVLAAGSII